MSGTRHEICSWLKIKTSERCPLLSLNILHIKYYITDFGYLESKCMIKDQITHMIKVYPAASHALKLNALN